MMSDQEISHGAWQNWFRTNDLRFFEIMEQASVFAHHGLGGDDDENDDDHKEGTSSVVNNPSVEADKLAEE